MKLTLLPAIAALLLAAFFLSAQPPSRYPYIHPPNPAATVQLPMTCWSTIVNGGTTSNAVSGNCPGYFSNTQQTFVEITYMLPATWDGGGVDGVWLSFLWGNPNGGGASGSIQWSVTGSCADLSTFYSAPSYPSPNSITVTVPALNGARLDYIQIPTTGCVSRGANVLRVKLSNTIGGPSTFGSYVYVSAYSLEIRQ